MKWIRVQAATTHYRACLRWSPPAGRYHSAWFLSTTLRNSQEEWMAVDRFSFFFFPLSLTHEWIIWCKLQRCDHTFLSSVAKVPWDRPNKKITTVIETLKTCFSQKKMKVLDDQTFSGVFFQRSFFSDNRLLSAINSKRGENSLINTTN